MDEKAKLQKEVADARRRLNKIEDAEREAVSRQFVGKCFKYRNNYSVPQKPSDYWWMYCKVLRMKPGGHLELFCFQTDKDGRIRIEPDEMHSWRLTDGYQQIRLTEFMRAWRALLKRLNQFRMVPTLPVSK